MPILNRLLFVIAFLANSLAYAGYCPDAMHTVNTDTRSFTSEDGTKFFQHSETGSSVIDTKTGTTLAKFGPSPHLTPIFFDHDRQLVTLQNYGNSGNLVLTNLKTGESQGYIHFSKSIRSLTSTQDNKVLILTGDARSTRFHYFDLEQKKYLWPNQELPVNVKVLEAQGDRAILTDQKSLYQISLSDGKITSLPQVTDAGTNTLKDFVFARLSSDHRHAITYERIYQDQGGGALDHSWLEVWNLETNELTTLSGKLGLVHSAEFIHQDREILLVHDQLIETKNAQSLADVAFFRSNKKIDATLAFSDEKLVAIAAGNRITILKADGLENIFSFVTNQEKISSFQASADGKKLTTISKDDQAIVWNLDGVNP